MDGIIALQQAQSSAAGKYARNDSHLYLPPGWNTGWKAAVAAQGTTPAWIMFDGDSRATGQGSTDWLNNGWAGKLRASLLARAGYSAYGDYYPATSYVNGLYTSQTGTMPYSSVTSTGVTESTGYGRALNPSTSQNPTTTFTSPNACTAIDIVYIDYGNGSSLTWTYAIDGGSAVTVTCTGPGTQTGAQVKKVTVTGLANTTHTVAIGQASSGNALFLLGIGTRYGSAGIGFVRNTYPGMKLIDLGVGAGGGPTGARDSSTANSGNTASFPTDKCALWQGQNPGGDSPTTQTGFGWPTAPAAAVLAWGTNDCNYGAPVRAYSAVLRRRINALRRGNANASIILLANMCPDGTNSTDAGAPGQYARWHEFKAAMQNAALTYGCAYVDMDAKWGPTPVAQGFMTSGQIHETDAGHNDIANTLAAIL